MPRRTEYAAAAPANEPSMQMETLRFQASVARTIFRIFYWVYALVYFAIAILYDRMRGRRSTRDRASRLRQSLETVGGTFVKLGQQMAMRLDLLPMEYCNELGKMLDANAPFPFRHAIEAIERSLGAPPHEVFRSIDPDPIGSASIACVYQGYLRNGRKVAIKVRRPNIGQIFAADLRALNWILSLLERCTIVRPGFTENLRSDLHDMLLEELDLRRECRFQYLFRKQAKKSKIRYISAPRTYPKLSSHEVLVQDFITGGIWLSELLAAVESADADKLAEYRAMGIRPKRVAHRLMKISYWSIHENLFFHADPHPRNIAVMPGSKLVFIDFGACGSPPPRLRRCNSEALRCLYRNDVNGAARASLIMVEPLAHIDVDDLTKRFEMAFQTQVFGLRDKHAAWWERTSASLWLQFLEHTRHAKLPVARDSLRIMRATLLYDTLSARLYPKLMAFDKQYGRYARGRARRRGKKILNKMGKTSPRQRGYRTIEKLEDAMNVYDRLQSRFQHMADNPPIKTSMLATKASFFVATLVGFAARAALLTGLVGVAAVFYHSRVGQGVSLDQIAASVLSNPGYLVALAGALMLSFRRIQFRLGDRDRD